MRDLSHIPERLVPNLVHGRSIRLEQHPDPNQNHRQLPRNLPTLHPGCSQHSQRIRAGNEAVSIKIAA